MMTGCPPPIVAGMTSSRGFRMLSSGEETMAVDRERPRPRDFRVFSVSRMARVYPTIF